MKIIRKRYSPPAKWMAAILTAIMLVSAIPGLGRAEMVPVRFMSSDGVWHSYETDFRDSVFEQDCGEYQPELARMSIAMAVSAFRDWEKPENKQHLGEDFLSRAGFTDIRSWDYEGEPTKDTIGMLIGRKRLENQTVVALVPSGEYYRKEWVSNLHVGEIKAEPITRHEGFYRAAEKAFTRLMEYTRDIRGPWSLWSSGFSRAGAVANITASMVLGQGVLPPERVYVYTFASPSHTRLSASDCPEEMFQGCWNILSPYDVIPWLFPSVWEFDRFGHTVLLPDPEDEEGAEKLRQAAARWSMENFRAEWYQNNMSFILRRMTDRLLSKAVPTPEAYVRYTQEFLMAEMNRVDSIEDMFKSIFGDGTKDETEPAESSEDSDDWTLAESIFGMSFGEYFEMCFSHGHRPMNYIPAVMCADP